MFYKDFNIFPGVWCNVENLWKLSVTSSEFVKYLQVEVLTGVISLGVSRVGIGCSLEFKGWYRMFLGVQGLVYRLFLGVSRVGI